MLAGAAAPDVRQAQLARGRYEWAAISAAGRAGESGVGLLEAVRGVERDQRVVLSQAVEGFAEPGGGAERGGYECAL